MNRPRHLPRALARAFLLTIIALAFAAPLIAQFPLPDTSKLKRIFGVGDDEFFKGAWMKVRPDTAGAPDNLILPHAGQLWELADELGIDILRIQGEDFGNFALTEALIAQRTKPETQRLIISHVGEDFHKVSVARDIRLYPFTGLDSVEYALWPVKFMSLSGGITDTNTFEKDVYDQPAKEQHYKLNSTSANTVIARDIVFDQFPARIHRWPMDSNGFVHRADSVQDTEEFLANTWQFNSAATSQFVVVTGHLFRNDTSTIQATDTILKIEVLYEIPSGSTAGVCDAFGNLLYYTSSNVDVERTMATFYVLKSDLSPANPTLPNWNAYREVALRFDARWCPDPIYLLQRTGPLYPGNTSRRINLKVTWTGREGVALRSIGLRDSLGQLVLGNSGIDTAGQFALLQGALRDARRGVTLTNDGDGPAQWPIIARSATIESRPMHSAACNLLTKLVRDSIQADDEINGGSDSMPVWNEVNTNYALFQRWTESANPGLAVPDAVVTETGIGATDWLAGRLGLVNDRIPSIADHNGGRFGIPLLDLGTPLLRAFVIEYGYESTLQLLGFHQYAPYRLDHNMEHFLHFELGRAAEVARDQRRRLIIVPFCVAAIWVNYIEGGPQAGPKRDTISALHLPEPAELRTMMNLGLCYGAKGVLWQVIEGHYNFMDSAVTATDSAGMFLYNRTADFGVHSPLVRGPNLDRFAKFKFVVSSRDNGYADTNAQATVDSFFTGWNIRSKALTDIHRWIDIVGPELMKLDWRDGYSMHFTVAQPYDTTIPFRPLASNEIVTQVKSRRPSLATYDSASRTFVELGLFYTKNSTPDPALDTNFIFLVNRRCFESTTDLLGTALGTLMDSLAESRVIRVRFRLPHPDSTGYNFLRVTELGGDTTRLPLASVRRAPLDTIIYADSAMEITLGPGRAALLRITYCSPDQSIVNGQTAWNSQRKLIWDGNRHHTCYMRYDTTRNDTCIFYRRSLPVSDSTGAILWEPIEWNISAHQGEIYPDTVRTRNGYPSLTMRTTGGDSVISIIWSCHPAQSGHSTEREIVVRDVGYFLQRTDSIGGPVYSAPYFSTIRHIDWYSGSDASAWLWGTPTIGSEKGGDFLIWSDSLTGIVGRVRSVSYGGFWPLYWQLVTNYVHSPAYSISGQLLAGAKYPSIPPFAKVTPGDSSSVVVWEHPYYAPYATAPTNIMLERLVHTTSGGLPVLVGTSTSNVLTASLGDHHHPSIDLDQTDGTGGRRQYGVAWIELLPTVEPDSTITRVNFKSVLDSAGTMNTSLPEARLSMGGSFTPRLYVFPNVSGIQRNDVADSARFGVVLHRYDTSGKSIAYMKQGRVAFRAPFFRTFYNYEWGGQHPAGSGSRSNQSRRYAALYQDTTTTGQRLIRTSRQFFAKQRPRSYMAEGRELLLHLDDSAHGVIRAGLFDVWVAKDSAAGGLGFVARSEARTDTLAKALEIMRTVNFQAHDSVTIGFESGGFLTGDSTATAQARLGWVVELVDSATGSVVHVLDSISISAISPIASTTRDTTLDLLSGTYFIRVRVDTTAIQSTRMYEASRYPVAELAGFVEQAPASKLARLAGSPGATARITAQPNPFDATSEILFSIPRSEYVSITLHDPSGREVKRLLDRQLMEAGRYATSIDSDELSPGIYLVELRHGRDRIVEKVVVVR